MRKARVLVVDDSVVVRRLVARALEDDPRIEVVSSAPNGRIACEKVRQYEPDLVVLDIEMPEMDGLEALTRIKGHRPDTHVVMYSVLTERGASATLDALSLGAVDYVTKPVADGSGQDLALDAIREQLVPKIVALCLREEAAPVAVKTAPRRERTEPKVVAIAASTGGPQALTDLLCALPEDFAPPVLVVQHMPPLFTELFAKRLDRRVPLPVAQAESGQPLKPGVWIAPGGRHLVADCGRLVFNEDPLEHGCRPSADVLFRSVAEEYGPAALAVVLSGMGRDGCSGAAAIYARGGTVLAQDQASSAVWGMPRYVVEAGVVAEVGTPEQIAARACALARGVVQR